MMKSNLQIKSNLMVEGRKQLNQCVPGDLAAKLYNLHMTDPRCRPNSNFTQQQIDEYLQTIPCSLCKRPCAGTCKAS